MSANSLIGVLVAKCSQTSEEMQNYLFRPASSILPYICLSVRGNLYPISEYLVYLFVG